EEKSFAPLSHAGTPDEAAVIQAHFDARDASEAEWFAGHAALAVGQARTRRVAPGACSAATEVEQMLACGADMMLVFGTGILKEPLLSAFAGRIINLHLGLSPYYRGAGTNFWPLVNGEPEYVGATIHYLDAGIDTGPMIAHVRPEVESADGPNEIGNRTIVAAARCLAEAARAHAEGRVRATVQTGGGRLYRRRDFNASAVLAMRENFASGMVPQYLARKTERDARVPILSLGAGPI
ncbi:MAG: formyltransferase family protein, partial [Vicinamibacterales bacterium]